MMRLSKTNPLKGIIKHSPEDFIVEEITKTGKVLGVDESIVASDIGVSEDPKGKFIVFIMQKKDWNTIQALNALAKKVHRGIRSVAFAGTKDRTSISTQLCSIYGASRDILMSTHVKDIKINSAWQSNCGVKMGDLSGNRFTATIRGMGNGIGIVSDIAAELGGIFPNYFGAQRFGSRDNNTKIGLSILKGDFESCAMSFLTDTVNERNLDSIEARERLANEGDFVAAMNYFPKYLKYERSVIQYLSQHPTDFANAMRRLPRQLMLMFVHSVEAMIFNMEVETRLKLHGSAPIEGDLLCGADRLGFPDISNLQGEGRFILGNIVGYETNLNDIEKEILEKLGITSGDFKVGRMPELNCKGGHRVIFAPFTGFSFADSGDNIRMSFSLPSGSYATVLLSEFISISTDAT